MADVISFEDKKNEKLEDERIIRTCPSCNTNDSFKIYKDGEVTCSICGTEQEGVRLIVEDAPEGIECYFCPKCDSAAYILTIQGEVTCIECDHVIAKLNQFQMPKGGENG